MPLPPELVIFDCDGVLVDSEPVALELVLEDLTERGLKLTLEDSHKLFVGGTIWGAGEIARKMGADIPEGWAKAFYEKLFVELAKGVPLVHDVVGLIDDLEACGIQTAIVSNGSERKMEITLGPHGLWDRFQERIFSAHTLGVAKPDPEIIHIALRQFGISPDRTVFVDDSPSGCKAGIAAGVTTIGFAEHNDAARLVGVCDHLTYNMQEVRGVLGV